MNCTFPVVLKSRVVVNCGQCISCRITKASEWSTRMLMESMCHKENSFVTLSYDDKHLPHDRSLKPKHLSDWLKRLRSALDRDGQQTIRFYATGEYGERTSRPHYHALIFGAACRLQNLEARIGPSGRPYFRCHCRYCETVRKTWNMGDNITIKDFGVGAAKYCARYVVKKWTKGTDDREDGRHPEFARMSLRPGIGANFIPQLAEPWLKLPIERQGLDVPHGLQQGPAIRPYGKYITRKFREAVGRDPKAPEGLPNPAQDLAKIVYAHVDQICATPGMAQLKNQLLKNIFHDQNKQHQQNRLAKFLTKRSSL